MNNNHNSSLPLINAEDDEKWREAVALIQQLNLRFYRPNRWQLKIGATSYYPHKGTIFVDGDTRALPTRGLDALIRLLTGGRTSAPDQTPTHEPNRNS